MILIVTIIASMPLVGSTSGVADVTKDSVGYNAIITLRQLKVFDDSDITFRPDENLTRLELATVLSNILGFGKGSAFYDNEYADATANLPEYAPVYIVSQLNLMQGYADNTFRPYDEVSGEDFVAAILKLLGYGPLMANRKDESSFAIANMLGLTKGLEISGSSYVKRSIAAIVIMRALETEVLIQNFDYKNSYTTEKGKILLSEKMHIQVYEGKVFSANGISLVPEIITDKGEAVVGELKVTDDTFSLADMVGEKVKIYYKTDDMLSRHFVLHSISRTKEANITYINGKDVTSFKDNVLSYSQAEGSGRLESVRLSSKADVVFNKRSIDDLNESHFKLENGVIKLIDADDDGVYETAIIKSFQTMIVGSVNLTLNRIIDKYVDGLYIDIPDSGKKSEQAVIYKKNTQIEMQSLKAGDMLSIYWVPGSNLMEIHVEDNSISGVITQYDTEYIQINGVFYKLSQYFLSTNLPVFLGENVVARLDSEANVVTLTYSQSQWRYGYALDAVQGKGLRFEPKVKLVTQDGKIDILGISKSVIIDGATASRNDMWPILMQALDAWTYEGKQYISRQPIRYKISEDGLIGAIDTKNDLMDSQDKDRLVLEHSGTFNYRARAYTFYDSQGIGKFFVDDGSIVFKGITGENTPQARFDIDEKFYGVMDVSGFNDFTNRNVQAYSLEDGGLAKVIVISSAPKPDVSALSSNSYFGMVDKIVTAIDDSGEIVHQLNVYVAGTLRSYKFDHDFMVYKNRDEGTMLKQGDIIRFNESNGSISVWALQYDFENDRMHKMNGDRNLNWFDGKVSGGVAIYYGQAYYADSRFIRLSINRNEDGVYDFTPAGLAAFDVLTAPMIKFDVKSGKISKGSYADITTYQQSKEQISYVFVSLRSGTVSNVFVINR
ncbi:MAG: S-layer homology domain-containing protein [Eubacteriales bacterium]|jgi:hypothetical protein|nr:S-layer homology domain-containing protein [Eubacteriales bacterium]